MLSQFSNKVKYLCLGSFWFLFVAVVPNAPSTTCPQPQIHSPKSTAHAPAIRGWGVVTLCWSIPFCVCPIDPTTVAAAAAGVGVDSV